MPDLAIYGAGGLGREVAVMVRQMNEHTNRWNLVGFYDDGKKPGDKVEGLRVLGGVKELNAIKSTLSVCIAMADPAVRKSTVSKITSKLVNYPVLIHPRAITGDPGNEFGRGVIITADCILTTGIKLGDFVIVNLAVTIGHDVRIGNYSAIMPGTNISGNVKVGERTLIGTGSQILQNLTIGNNSIVGAASVVTKNFGNNVTIIGIPGKQK